MRRSRPGPRAATCILLLLAALLGAKAVAQQVGDKPAGAPEEAPAKAKLGAITVERAAGRFAVPGVIVRLDPPLEFLAVTKGGVKAYESLIELETDAKTFNLACILLGFDAKKAKGAERHFDPSPAQGDPVRLWLGWGSGGERRRVPAGECLKVAGRDRVPEEWVYTGSTFTPDGHYLAEIGGTVVGFVHDPGSIIQHKGGLGLGNYGAVAGAPDRCPPVGTAVELTVERVSP